MKNIPAIVVRIQRHNIDQSSKLLRANNAYLGIKNTIDNYKSEFHYNKIKEHKSGCI